MDWLGRLEAWCASVPARSEYLGLHREFAWLRDAVPHQLPGAYAPGTQADRIVHDLRGLPHARPGAYAPSTQHRELPQDTIAQQYPVALFLLPCALFPSMNGAYLLQDCH